MTETVQTASAASVNGTPVAPVEAIKAAAALLAGSRTPVVAGLGTDIAGARASVALARAIGASIDHMDAGAVFANLDVMRRTGWIVTTPLQVRTRADTVLLVGDGLTEAWPEMAERLGLEAPPTLTGGARRVFRLSAGSTPGGTAPFSVMAGPGSATHDLQGPATPKSWVTGPSPVMPQRGGGSTILATLAALRALTAGRATTFDTATAAPLRTLAAVLSEARFGAAIWSAAALDTLAIEMLCGLIDDLNRKTRFAGLPLVAANGAEGVTQATAWTTGFPVRTGFAGSEPLHDPWRFDTQRLIASGEADAAVWISAFSATPPPWDDAVPTIALVPPQTAFRTSPAVVVEVGCPGRDHDAMLFDPALGGIAFTTATATASRAMPGVAGTLAAITAALPAC